VYNVSDFTDRLCDRALTNVEEQLWKERMNLNDCKMLDLPKIVDHRGNLTFIEQHRHVPFEIKRVYYLYDVPGGGARGGHAHREQHEFIIAAMGSFDVILNDGKKNVRHHLNRSYYGLYTPPLIWRELDNFSSGSVCLVLASDIYDEKDYVRDYDEFMALTKATG
jgi:dTDP-4-dehydrorhamnose 3,5-epimerase-like enzyme